MAGLVDFEVSENEDGTITLSLKNPAAVGSIPLGFYVMKHFGGVPFISKYTSSGNTSGIEVIQSGQGVIRTHIYNSEFSGHGPGNYASQWRRLDSGYLHVVSEGFITRNF